MRDGEASWLGQRLDVRCTVAVHAGLRGDSACVAISGGRSILAQNYTMGESRRPFSQAAPRRDSFRISPFTIGRIKSIRCARGLLTDDAELCILLVTAVFRNGAAITVSCRTATPPTRLAAIVESAPAPGPSAAAIDRTAVVLVLPTNPNIVALTEGRENQMEGG